ncbi:MAG TPA: tetratricopeptide repeat protein, partial [Pirellulaceae bacterium]|nr:tetratricopeptide repeat protein [Pirellulaceae bacterium]
ARPAPAIVQETPAVEPAPKPPAEAKRAPEMKPAPIVNAAPVVPAPVKPAAPQREVTRPQIAAIPQHLAALEYTPHKNIRPAGFQEVTPGQSKLSSIAEHLGEPISTEHQGDSTVMTYEVGPFPKVEVILAGDLVDSVVIHLKDAAPEADVLTELGLANFTPVDVTDDEGNLLGKAIPERGVALSYAGDAAEGHVAQVVLATITAEPFLMRALATHDNRYASILADAEYAFTLDKRSAEARAVTARVLAALGRVSEARAAVEDAIQLDPGATDYRLMYAKLLSQSGDFANALKMVETIAGTASVPPEFVAQAEQQWGELLANGPEHDYAAAIEHYTTAIKLAAPLSQSEDVVLRRAALRTLVDANLAVASAVAAGNYKRKPEVVPKWISKAEAFGQLALQDGTDPYLRLYVPAKTLAAYAKLEEPIDPTPAIETAITAAQELIAEATDPLYKHQLEWELGCALLDAVQIEHNRGQFELAVQYANNALVLMGDNAAQREATPQRDYQLGKLFFATGALYAIGFNDHAEAVHYYLEALPLLSLPLAAEFKAEASNHGERFVSMGVSFWQNGNRDQAIELTLTGVKHLREGIEKGSAEQQALAVPYGNLAAMYRQLGNAGEAKKYTELARRLEPPATTTRR